MTGTVVVGLLVVFACGFVAGFVIRSMARMSDTKEW